MLGVAQVAGAVEGVQPRGGLQETAVRAKSWRYDSDLRDRSAYVNCWLTLISSSLSAISRLRLLAALTRE